MARSSDSITGFVLYNLFLLATTLIAILFCIAWYLSPLGLGFARWPIHPDHRLWADTAYRLSYFAGIPLLIVGQAASAILDAKGRRRLAYIVPCATLLFFIATASMVLLLLEQ